MQEYLGRTAGLPTKRVQTERRIVGRFVLTDGQPALPAAPIPVGKGATAAAAGPEDAIILAGERLVPVW